MSLRLEPELRKILLELAEREDRTPSQMARILLREAVEARKPVAVREKKR
jgi:predicted transcriptional regulator